MTETADSIVLKRVDEWRRRLIDLSYRNRLIKYRRTTASTIEIEAPSVDELLADLTRRTPWRFYYPPDEPPDEQLDLEAADFIDDVVVQKAKRADRAPQPDEIVVRGEPSAHRINRILENLARKSNAEFQDKALRILYIAAGFLDWRDEARGEDISSPLILVPVELRRVSASEPYHLYFVDDEEVVVNPSLTEKLRRDLKLEIPSEWTWEDKGISVELDEIEASVREHGWAVRREAVLGLFSFQKFVMYRDLLDNEELIANHPVVMSLALRELGGPLEGDVPDIPPLDALDEVQPPADDLTILDADSTQRRCIEAAKLGQTFVIHGPPGTGKSQTIANVIADAIGRGKRVLFVSEKAAALDVVYKRLTAHGLDEFCLLLHGEHASRHEVVESLHRSLTGETVPRRGMTSSELDRLSHLREVLNDTAQIVHLPMERLGDRSLWEVLGDIARLHAVPSVPAAPEASDVSGATVRQEFQRLDELYQSLSDRWHVSPRSFAWRDFAAERFSVDDHGRVVDLLTRYARTTSQFEHTSDEVARSLGWPAPMNARAAKDLIALGRHLLEAPPLDEHWLAPGSAEMLALASETASAAFARVARSRAKLEATYSPERVEVLPEDPASDLREALRRLDQAIGRTSAWDAELLRRLPRGLEFLAGAETTRASLAANANRVAELLGQPATKLTIQRCEELAELAALAFRTEDRPEREWLVRAGADRARDGLNEHRAAIEEFQEARRLLLDPYQPDFLGLDGRELQRRFAEEYTSFFARLGGNYRSDAKALRAVRRDGKVSATVRDDLAQLVRLQELRAQLGGAAERLRVAWGTYDAGPDTELAALERALENAARVRALAAPDSDLEALGDRISAGSAPDTELAQLADRVRPEVAVLQEGIDGLRPIASHLVPDSVLLTNLAELLAAATAALTPLDALRSDLNSEAREEIHTLQALRARAELVSELREAEQVVVEQSAAWELALGRLYAGPNTDWAAATAIAEWLRRFEQRVSGAIPGALKEELLSEERRWPDFAGLYKTAAAFAGAADALAEKFEGSRPADLMQVAQQGSFEEIAGLCDELQRHVDDLYHWTEFRSRRQRLREAGWSDFLDQLVDREVTASDVIGSFQRAYWTRRLEALFEDDPELADSGATYARWIDEFGRLDRRLVATAADRVITARNRMRTTRVAAPGSQVALVRQEALKSRRHMPVRKLLAAIPSLLSEIKPCLMMSPLTVSHFLAPTHEFDLVIFDEASQVPPQDAVNCIYRGRQLIVAGDTRQLPPTPFFQVAEAEELWSDDAEEVSEDMESILDSCEALLPTHPLRWHYRSRNEDLIAFSNQHIYDDALLTFPAADGHSLNMGIRFTYVEDGVYDRGATKVNRREAQIVAERVIAYLRGGRYSVGVIAFNTQQANAIAEEIERLRIVHPDLEKHFAGDRLDAVFVKHLESVQGDERDIIVFSFGFGRDPDGKFTMNFGPLNKEGGHRRLNVAVTRARELVEVVASVYAADFTLSENASRGARLLREYLRYAEAGGATGASAATVVEAFPSTLEEAIAEAVGDLGFEAVPQVGIGAFRVDIGVRDPRDPGRYVLGIETDGPSYREAPTARDRDRLREEVLAALGWRIHRIWSLDWARNRQSEVDRLMAALAGPPETSDAHELDDDGLPERERAEVLIADLNEAVDSAKLPWVVEYERATLPSVNTNYEFHVSVNRDQQRDLVRDLVAVESPVHIDYAIRRLVRAWGLGRTSDRIRAAAKQAIGMAVRSGLVEERGEFLWKPGHELTFVRSPQWKDDRTYRAIYEIAPEEIDMAFSKLAEASGTLERDVLIPQVAKVLGFDRVGANIRDALEARLEAGRDA